jgi:hypothetical protein
MLSKTVKVVGGDFVGTGAIHYGILWLGPKANKFQGITLKKPKKNYRPDDVVKFSELQNEQAKSFLGSALSAAVGAALFGRIGLVAGALAGGNTHKIIAAVEFSDGNKVDFTTDLNDQAYSCLKLYAVKNMIISNNF